MLNKLKSKNTVILIMSTLIILLLADRYLEQKNSTILEHLLSESNTIYYVAKQDSDVFLSVPDNTYRKTISLQSGKALLAKKVGDEFKLVVITINYSSWIHANFSSIDELYDEGKGAVPSSKLPVYEKTIKTTDDNKYYKLAIFEK